ncbi:NlpC/P60 family protein [Nocardiopsis sp. LOL_012]|uniref:C40 family peptidase n=1 Tax=Nocardiopsis sp. LOL_012 TaxID=3345409 RepID=UPI003A8B8E1B
MSSPRSPRRRRTAVVASLAAGSLLLPASTAYAEPTIDDVRAEIEALEEEYASLNAEYNEAQETHEAAEENLEEIQENLEEAQETVDELGASVRTLANLTYTGVDLTSPAHIIGATGPEDVLSHQADLTYLSEQQNAGLERYVEELAHLESLEAEAAETEEEAAEALEAAEEAEEEAADAIAEQEALLADLTAEQAAAATENVSNDSGGTSGGGGGATYTGPATGSAQTALNFAYAQVGKPYIWGGTGPGGYDCSGLTQAAWAAAGVNLPRTTYSQVNAGTRVSWDNMQPGDLIFFYSGPDHVGMYAGNNVMVHASNSSKPIGTVTLNSYYRQNFYAAVRP